MYNDWLAMSFRGAVPANAVFKGDDSSFELKRLQANADGQPYQLNLRA